MHVMPRLLHPVLSSYALSLLLPERARYFLLMAAARGYPKSIAADHETKFCRRSANIFRPEAPDSRHNCLRKYALRIFYCVVRIGALVTKGKITNIFGNVPIPKPILLGFYPDPSICRADDDYDCRHLHWSLCRHDRHRERAENGRIGLLPTICLQTPLRIPSHLPYGNFLISYTCPTLFN